MEMELNLVLLGNSTLQGDVNVLRKQFIILCFVKMTLINYPYTSATA